MFVFVVVVGLGFLVVFICFGFFLIFVIEYITSKLAYINQGFMTRT